MLDVVALGELLIDFTARSVDEYGYPTLVANPGGAPGNFLAALQKYGCTTAMLAKVGSDAFGRLLVNTLREKGVDVRGVLTDPEVFTTLAFVTLDAKGNREFSFARKPGADTRLTEAEVDYALIKAARVFHFGTLSLTDEPARTATQAAVRYAQRRHKYISFDPNLRTPLWPGEQQAREQIEWGLKQADIVKISDEEVDFLWGLSPAQAAQKLLREYSARLVYVTLGPEGCWFANAQGSGKVSAPQGVQAVDTTGAGDIFGGAAMSRFLKLGKQPQDLSIADMRAIVEFACCAASLSTQAYGGINSVVEQEQVCKTLL